MEVCRRHLGLSGLHPNTVNRHQLYPTFTHKISLSRSPSLLECFVAVRFLAVAAQNTGPKLECPPQVALLNVSVV